MGILERREEPRVLCTFQEARELSEDEWCCVATKNCLEAERDVARGELTRHVGRWIRADFMIAEVKRISMNVIWLELPSGAGLHIAQIGVCFALYVPK